MEQLANFNIPSVQTVSAASCSSKLKVKSSFYCKCLNTKMDCCGESCIEPNRYELDSLKVALNELSTSNSDWKSTSPFAGAKVLICTERFLKESFLSSSIRSLQVTKRAANWKLSLCFSCKTFTHAYQRGFHRDSHSGDETLRVMINVQDLIDEQEKEVLANERYSSVFGLVISDAARFRVVDSAWVTNQSSITTIREKAADFLANAKAAMIEKIADFERSQKASFYSLEQQINSDTDLLERQVALALQESNDSEDSAYEPGSEDSQDVDEKPSRSPSFSDEAFDLDPFNDGEAVPFLDQLDDDDNVPNYVNRKEKADASGDILAKSVPISIPRMHPLASYSASDSLSDSDGDGVPDHRDMQASIQALAKSIGVDGTEMFGDLPRPRFNTFDRYY